MKALAVVVGYTFLGSLAILKITDLIFPMSISAEEKKVGSDYSQHGENLYPVDYTTLEEKIG
jgi:Amt family ammonium transporter